MRMAKKRFSKINKPTRDEISKIVGCSRAHVSKVMNKSYVAKAKVTKRGLILMLAEKYGMPFGRRW